MTSEQIAAAVDEIRRRVRARYEKQVDGLPDFCLPSLTPLLETRDSAEGKVASIGTVNPRSRGVINSIIQGTKKLIARALAWHVREQIEFNRAVTRFMEQTVAVMEEQNRHMLMLGRLGEDVRRMEELRSGWMEWRTGWEEKWARTEVQFLRSVAELQGAFQHRVTLLESSYREHLHAQHSDYLGALDRTTLDLQKRLWEDMTKLRAEFERMIHTELRLIRQRAQSQLPSQSPVHQAEPNPAPPSPVPKLDWLRFADRFRGSRDYVASGQRFYLPYFQGRTRVVDLGCGRGEFLELMKQNGIEARGVDSDPDAVALCRQNHLEVEEADLFRFLDSQPDSGFDGIFSAQVVEHLPPAGVLEMVRLAAQKLERGGILAIETPNPECLAIFATNFYLDPTHVRPVPSAQLHFYLEENGFGAIEVHQLAPAADIFPEVAALGAADGFKGFQQRFFGGLDYAIIGKKL